MSRIASDIVSGWRTRTPISSWEIRAAHFRLTDVCGGIMTRVKAKLLIAKTYYELTCSRAKEPGTPTMNSWFT
jgi:hypothetical protein